MGYGTYKLKQRTTAFHSKTKENDKIIFKLKPPGPWHKETSIVIEADEKKEKRSKDIKFFCLVIT